MATAKRVTTVQVPGDTGQDAAPLAESQSEAAAADLQPAQDVRPTRAQYLQMRAADVDPTTLTAAVLTKDGWVAPHPKAKA